MNKKELELCREELRNGLSIEDACRKYNMTFGELVTYLGGLGGYNGKIYKK